MGLTCTDAVAATTCTTPTIEPDIGTGFTLTVYPATGFPVGDIEQLDLTVNPTGGADAFPHDNSATLRVINPGVAKLTIVGHQSAQTVAKKGIVTFTITITNNGPDPTRSLGYYLRILTPTVNGFAQLKPTGPGSSQPVGGESGYNSGPNWVGSPGDLDPGESLTIHVSWRGLKLGAHGQLSARVFGDYNQSSGEFVEADSEFVTVVQPTATSSGGRTTTSGTGGTTLAATGPASAVPLGVLAFGLLLAGAGVLYTERRTRRHAH